MGQFKISMPQLYLLITSVYSLKQELLPCEFSTVKDNSLSLCTSSTFIALNTEKQRQILVLITSAQLLLVLIKWNIFWVHLVMKVPGTMPLGNNAPYSISYKVSRLIRNSQKAIQRTSGLTFAAVHFESINLYGSIF